MQVSGRIRESFAPLDPHMACVFLLHKYMGAYSRGIQTYAQQI
jgi:hypothetical protein